MINIKKLLKEFSSSQSPFHKEIRRHISWAINLIPIFSSILDNNTIKRIKENK